MKILKLVLVNYGAIKTGMGCDKITIDFTKSNNKIILLSGPNGTGKTAILSSLHPFASNGTFDVRNKQPLIIKGKNGYKEIIIENDGDVYEIKHYYTPSKTSYTVKSYMKKNGMELNENGNVTSFMSLIKDELGLDMDYLRLMRLGNNVTNFIGMSGLERKNYMGNMINTADIYLQYYKKLTNDMRELKNLLSHTVDKLGKLNISDEDAEKDRKKTYESQLEEMRELSVSLSQRLAVVKYEIENRASMEEIISESKIVKGELDDVDKMLSKKTFKKVSPNVNVSELEKKLISLKAKESAMKEKRDVYLEIIDSVTNKLQDAQRNLKNEINRSDITALEEIIKSIEQDISKTNPTILEKIDTVLCTTDDVLELMKLINNQEDLMTITKGFGQGPIKQAIKFITKDKDISDYVCDNIMASRNQSMAEHCKSIYDQLCDGIVFKSNCSDKNCPMYKFWDKFYTLVSLNKDDEIKSEEFYTYAGMAFDNIKLILRNIADKRDLILKMPSAIRELFSLETMFDHMKKDEPIFDMKIVNSLLMFVKECDNYKDKLRLLSEKEIELENLKKTSNVDFLSTTVQNLVEERRNATDTFDKLTHDLETIRVDIDNLDDEIVMATSFTDITDKKKNLEDRKAELIDQYNTLKCFIAERDELEKKISSTNFIIEKKTDELNNLTYRLMEYKKLRKELESLQDEYDELELIKRANSAKEGIPTILIERYFSTVRSITNKLLENVYDKELKIVKFDVQPESFNIPYKRKGVVIPDAVYASDGERACISLALSFALSYRSMCNYNIMLLDEVDGALDNVTRMSFVHILECLIDMVGMEQVFIISHNNVFDTYPLDILSTVDDIQEEKNKLGYIIPIKKGCATD